MKVLVVGSGGREHAIVWKLSQSPKVDKIYCAPGNAGIGQLAELVNIGAMEFHKLIEFVKSEGIDFTVVGMDDPLVGGIVDAFEKEGLRIFGPRANAAIIEGSKAFSKELMRKYNIPTAEYGTFSDYDLAVEHVKNGNFPVVLKADGLALGKGVLICNTLEEALEGLKEIMLDKKFGDSGNTVVIEEFLTGPEMSVLSFCDGKTIVPMVSAQDHKRAYDNDEGLNTGGMVIFFGLMLTPKGMKVIEYNARFGDPETQVVLPRLKTDLMEIFEACVDGTLDKVDVQWEDNAAACVVMASGGYPVSYKKGYEITGLEDAEAMENITVFHAGTALKDGKFVTNGGRVLGVTGVGNNLDEAIKTAYEGVAKIDFKDKHFRKDIGIKKY